MVEALVKLAELFGNWVGKHSDRADQASLAARKALTLAASYVGDVEQGLPDDRDAQKAVAIACAEAASKLRRDFPELAKEFTSFGNFWSSGAVTKVRMAELNEHVRKLEDMVIEKNLLIA